MSRTAESAMFDADDIEDYKRALIADIMQDRENLVAAIEAFKMAISWLNPDVVWCDHNRRDDMLEALAWFDPPSAEKIAEQARDIAEEWAQENR